MIWTRHELKNWSVLVFVGTTLVYAARSALPVVSGLNYKNLISKNKLVKSSSGTSSSGTIMNWAR